MVTKHPLSLPGIYRIESRTDRKVYIGQGRKVSQRWTIHRWDLADQSHANGPLQEAWDRLGPEDFTWDIVWQPIGPHDPEVMTEAERSIMGNYREDELYNLIVPIQAYIGAGESTRKKLSEINSKRWEDADYKARLKASHAKIRADPAYKERHAAAMRAFYETDESSAIRRAGGAKASAKWANDETLREVEGTRRRELWEDPEHRTKQAASRSASWKDPESRAKRMAGLQGSWDRLTPEQRAERSAKMLAGKKATPEERSANVKKAWEKRRANAAAKLAAAQADLWDGEVL